MTRNGHYLFLLLTSVVLAATQDAVGLTFIMMPPPETRADVVSFSQQEPVPEGQTAVTKMTEVLTVWNAVVLFCMLLLVVKVIKAPANEAVEASEDMSISKQLLPVMIWSALGIALVCFNKYMYLTPDKGGFGFPCPTSLTWWHMLFGMLATNIVRLVRPELMPAVHEGKLSYHGYCTAVVPIGVVFAAYLALGNTAYLYLSVSFVQMLKSAGPMSVFVISVACGFEKLSWPAVISIIIVVMGVAGASVGEIAFSWFGFSLQFSAFILDGMRMVLMKKLMSARGTQLDPLSALYYYSPVCVVFLAWPVYHFEGAKLATTLATAAPSLFAVIAVNGLVAFALNVSLLALFKRASPTTVSMASVCRDIFLAFGSAGIFHTTITKVQVLGYLSACVGVKLWDEVKARPTAFYKAFGIDEQETMPIVSTQQRTCANQL
jgi:hypothetical protein